MIYLKYAIVLAFVALSIVATYKFIVIDRIFLR